MEFTIDYTIEETDTEVNLKKIKSILAKGKSHLLLVKLDRVGPVDNRPSTNKLPNFVKKIK